MNKEVVKLPSQASKKKPKGPGEIEVKYDSSKIMPWRPATRTDRENIKQITTKVKTLWIESGLDLEDFVGLYFESKGFSDVIEIRVDHSPGVEVPETVNKYLGEIEIDVINK